MKLVDLNLLLYAVNADAPRHERARAWWEGTLGGEEQVAFGWIVLLGFLRLSTRAGVLPRPLTVEQATGVINEWLEQPASVIAHPGERHWAILRDLLRTAGTAGNLTTDAHLAALAIEHDATLCSTDRDFARFPGLRHQDPLS